MTVPTTLPRIRWTLRTGETYQVIYTRTSSAAYTAGGEAHTAYRYAGSASRVTAPSGSLAPVTVSLSLGAAWNDRSVASSIASALRDIGRSWAVYSVGIDHGIGGIPAIRPVTFPLTSSVVALLMGGAWGEQRAAGAASALRLMSSVEAASSVTTYCTPMGAPVRP